MASEARLSRAVVARRGRRGARRARESPRRGARRSASGPSSAGEGSGSAAWFRPRRPSRGCGPTPSPRPIRRRAAGEPLAHVTGRTGFRHLTLRRDRRALIPRPETEGLVDLVLARVRGGRVRGRGHGERVHRDQPGDRGRYQQVMGIDLSPDALALASENRRATGARVDARAGRPVRAARAAAALDALVSNPPYLTAAEHATPGSRRCGTGSRPWRSRREPTAWRPRSRLLDGRRVVPARRVARAGDRFCPGGALRRAGRRVGWTDVAIHATFSAASATCSRAGAKPVIWDKAQELGR